MRVSLGGLLAVAGVLVGCASTAVPTAFPPVAKPTSPRGSYPLGPATSPVARPMPVLSLDTLTASGMVALLPPGRPSEWVDAEDDSDTAMQTSVIGWWGTKGRERALRTFAEEEGKAVDWRTMPTGQVMMAVSLSKEDIDALAGIIGDPSLQRNPVPPTAMMGGAGQRLIRHLKLFRRQKLTSLKARHVAVFRVSTSVGPGGVGVGFVAAARESPEIFAAVYRPNGRLLLAVAGIESSQPPVSPVPSPVPTTEPTPDPGGTFGW